MIRIHFTYKHVDRPWGGANNFIRALRRQLAAEGDFVFVDRLDEPCDVVFMNQLSSGPAANGAAPKVREIRRLAEEGRRIAVRAVNLNRHAFRLGPRNMLLGWLRDRRAMALLGIADMAIFQSAYQRTVFAEAGYRGLQDVIIHNGADPIFWNESRRVPPRIRSCGSSPRRLRTATPSGTT
jgi:hypothetical protein